MNDLISKKAVIDLFEKYQPYMAVSVYEFGMALKALPSVQPDLQPTCNQLATDCISRQDAIDAVKRLHGVAWANWKETRISANTMIDALKDLPSAEPERKAGHWEFQGYQMFSCTCCSYIASQEQLESWRVKKTDSAFPLFCPNCGADMRGEPDE